LPYPINRDDKSEQDRMSNYEWNIRIKDFKKYLHFDSVLKWKIVENHAKLGTRQDAYANGVFLMKKAGWANIQI
jgi:hypothetical protein